MDICRVPFNLVLAHYEELPRPMDGGVLIHDI